MDEGSDSQVDDRIDGIGGDGSCAVSTLISKYVVRKKLLGYACLILL